MVLELCMEKTPRPLMSDRLWEKLTKDKEQTQKSKTARSGQCYGTFTLHIHYSNLLLLPLLPPYPHLPHLLRLHFLQILMSF